MERRAGIPQGLIIVIAGYLPILAIVSLFPAVPSIIDRFSDDPTASWKVPWMVTAPGLAIAIIAPFAGYLVDRLGRRKLLLWATFFYGAMGAAPFFLEGINAIFASRILLGITEAVIIVIVTTLIGDYWDDDGRRHWLAIQAAVGPFLSSGLILLSGALTTIRWNGVFLVYLVAFPIYAAMLAYVFEPRRSGQAQSLPDRPLDAQTPFPSRSVALVGSATFVCSIIFYVFIVNGGLAFREVGVQSAEELSRLTFLPSLLVFGGAVIFWLLGKKSPYLQYGVTVGLLAIGIVTMGVAPDRRWLIVGLCIQQLGSGMTVPVLIAWAQKALPFEHRGRGMGIWTACFFIGQFASPPIMAILSGATGSMRAAFVAIGALALVLALVAALFGLRSGPTPPTVKA